MGGCPRNLAENMNLVCVLAGCRPAPADCRCRRCGLERHSWKVTGSEILHQDMVGRTGDTCVYECELLVKMACTRCGAVTEKRTREVRKY